VFGSTANVSLNKNISECERLKGQNVEHPRKKEETLVHLIEVDVDTARLPDEARKWQVLQEKLDSTESGPSEKTSEYTRLKDRRDATVEVVEQLKKEIEEIKREKNALHDVIQSRLIELQELKDERDILGARLEDKSSEFDRIRGEIDVTVEELNKKEKELELVTEERDEAKEQLMSTQQELEHMKVMQVKNIELELTKAELQFTCNFQAEMERLNTQLKSKSVELVRAETTIEFLEKEIKELRKKLEEYEDINREILAEHVGSSSKQQPTSCSEGPLGEHIQCYRSQLHV